jgi:hypothetical protein
MIPILKGGWDCKGGNVLRADGYYLYRAGGEIHPLGELRWQTSFLGEPPTTYEQAHLPLLVAEAALDALVHRTIYKFRTSAQAGVNLLNAVRNLKDKIEASSDKTKTIDFMDHYTITSALTTYETVLGAELSLIPLYVVTQKSGFDTEILVSNGAACFPSDIWTKVPQAVGDLQQATKCIAFEVFTAAGFHLHRANEAVLQRYWDAVSGGQPRPKSRNMGDYLNELKTKNLGDEKVRAALKDLKDLHRNPLIHPEHSIDSLDEVVSLMSGVHTVIMHMLKEMPATMPTPALPGTP